MRHNDSHHDLHMVSCEELNQMRRTYAWRKLSEQVRAERADVPPAVTGLHGCLRGCRSHHSGVTGPGFVLGSLEY